MEVTSEDKDFLIESSLSIEPSQGWRAAQPGAQTILLVIDEPQELKSVSLVFEEDEMTRTREFVLRASNLGGPSRDIVRQQWTLVRIGQRDRSRNTQLNHRTLLCLADNHA